MEKFKPPYVGAAYYPEVWDQNEIEKDIKNMKEIGINVVRIAEFAWAYMEPEEGKYELEWLHNVVKQLEDEGISVVLCTPTATPPAWLTQKYPETLLGKDTGGRYGHGGRRHYCQNSDKYREFSRKITEKLAQEFSKYKSIIAWHLDNEIGWEINACYCDTCRKKFREWLKSMYKWLFIVMFCWVVLYSYLTVDRFFWGMDYTKDFEWFSFIPGLVIAWWLIIIDLKNFLKQRVDVQGNRGRC